MHRDGMSDLRVPSLLAYLVVAASSQSARCVIGYRIERKRKDDLTKAHSHKLILQDFSVCAKVRRLVACAFMGGEPVRPR